MKINASERPVFVCQSTEECDFLQNIFLENGIGWVGDRKMKSPLRSRKPPVAFFVAENNTITYLSENTTIEIEDYIKSKSYERGYSKIIYVSSLISKIDYKSLLLD